MTAHFGLDIGSYSIKLVQAEKKANNFQLITYGEVRTPVALNSEAQKDKVALAEAIKKLTADAKTTTKNISLALSETEVFSQIIELPYLSKAELAAAINFEAEQYIPVPLSEVQLEYLVLKTPPKGAIKEKMEVLLIAAKKDSLNRMVNLVEMAGLTPLSVETEVLALIKCLTSNQKQANLVIDLGNKSSDMMIIYEDNLKFVRTLNTGGEALTRALAQALNMDLAQAEQYKVSYGIDQSQLEGQVAKSLLSAFNIITEEIKKSLAFFSQKQPETKVRSIILTGGGAELKGISAYLAKLFNLEVFVFNPFDKFIKEGQFPEILGKPRFTVAAGLAMRDDG